MLKTQCLDHAKTLAPLRLLGKASHISNCWAFVSKPDAGWWERSLAWYGNYRRLARDYEVVPESSETFIYLASCDLMLKRKEVPLPEIGRKFEIESRYGDTFVIVLHDDGTREICGASPDNPEGRIPIATLSDDEARQVAGILGGLT